MKQCSTCKIEKDLCEFNKHKLKKDGLSGQCKECRKQYRIDNIDKIRKYRGTKIPREIKNIEFSYFKNRYHNDELFKLKHLTRDTIRKSITSRGFTKKSKTYTILGCDFEFFKNYLEGQFTTEMTWKNIHLDHIFPTSKAKTLDEIIQLNHYTNFQPLLAKDNIIKSNKLIEKQLKFL